MGEKIKLRGHPMKELNGVWFYCDNNDNVSDTWKNRECGECGRSNTKQGHDGCLGELTGVMNACCGHGVISESYIQFTNGKTVYGRLANIIINNKVNKTNPPDRR